MNGGGGGQVRVRWISIVVALVIRLPRKMSCDSIPAFLHMMNRLNSISSSLAEPSLGKYIVYMNGGDLSRLT